MPDRRLLVTGAASGIGRRTVAALGERGDLTAAADLDMARLRATAEEDGWRDVPLVELDVRDPRAWEAALDLVERRWGAIDGLVHVAGVIQPRGVLELSDAEIDHQLDVNLKGTILGFRAAARRMVPRGRGHLVLVNSMLGLAPAPGMTVYGASKFGARGFALGAAQELEPVGVHVVVVVPDGVDTPMAAYEALHDEAALTFSRRRLLTPDAVAQAIVFALDHRRLEVFLPRSRGWLSKAAGAFPRLALRLTPRLQARGLRRLRRHREET